MKHKIITAFTLLIIALPLVAQVRTYIYSKVNIANSWSGIKLYVDMGTPQEKVLNFNYNCIKDNDGKDKIFNTKMAALNYLAKDGWDLFNPSTNIDSTFLMRRDVSGMNEEQIQNFLSKYRIGPSGSKAKNNAQAGPTQAKEE